MEHNLVFVVLMGMGTVFFGLICIIFLTWIMGKVMGSVTTKAPAAAPAAAAPAPKATPAAPAVDPNAVAPEIVAVITAVLSEEVGIPSHGVNITNIKKL